MRQNFVLLFIILFNHDRYESVAGDNARAYAESFRSDIRRSLLGSIAAVAVGLSVAALCQRVSWHDPIAWGKASAAGGAFLAAWGTWFGIQDRHESWKKSRHDEKLRDFVFALLFVPGVVLGILGAIW